MTDLGEIKRDRPCNRRWLLRHGALALPFILVGIPARAVERVGSVEDSKGEHSPSSTRFAARSIGPRRSFSRRSRDRRRVPTGNAARPRYDDQAWRTSAAEDRSFLVDAGGEMTLRSGVAVRSTNAQRARGSADSQPLRADRRTGTQFFAGPSNGRFGVFVARGSVAVSSRVSK